MDFERLSQNGLKAALLVGILISLACNLSTIMPAPTRDLSTPTLIVAEFGSPSPTASPKPTDTPTPTATNTPPPTHTAQPTDTVTATVPPDEPIDTVVAIEVDVLPTATPEPVEESPPPEPIVDPAQTALPSSVGKDFVLRHVRLRNNGENSWDGVIGPGKCGNDHSIYVFVADAQENLLNNILVGDKFGNFEVPTGVDSEGMVRILVWSATMELSIVGHEDGTRYTSDFTPPLSTLDEQIPLDWLESAGYCESPEDCQWRVDNNQLCRGHYSYDVIFQRTW